jgi:hypothetical protein
MKKKTMTDGPLGGPAVIMVTPPANSMMKKNKPQGVRKRATEKTKNGKRSC